MAMKIDQVGLGSGTPGMARKGLSNGAIVTLTDTVASGTTLFEILWISQYDITALDSLAPTVNPHVWQFEPSANLTGPIRIRLTHTQGDVVTTETRIFGIVPADDPVDWDVPVGPAPGERADPLATLANATDPAVIARCERNWPTAVFPAGNPFGWGPDLLDMVAAGAGGGGGGGPAPPAPDVSHLVVTPAVTLEMGATYLVSVAATITLPDATDPLVTGRRCLVHCSRENNTLLYPAANSLMIDRGPSIEGPTTPLRTGSYEFRAFYDGAVYPQGTWLARSARSRALTIYPTADALNGDPDIAVQHQVLMGRLNLLDTTLSGAPMALDLFRPSGWFAIIDDRFALKVVVSGGGRTVAIAVPAGQQIEDLNGFFSSGVSLTAEQGMYCEWVLSVLGGTLHWLLVSHRPGFAGG